MTEFCDAPFEKSDACGGDPTGSWAFVASCGTSGMESLVRQDCPSATIERDEIIAMAGFFEFRLNSIETNGFSTDFRIEYTYEGTDCGLCEDHLVGNIWDTTCRPTMTGCRCTIADTLGLFALAGVGWDVTDNVLTTNGILPPYDLCVEGEQMRFRRSTCTEGPGCEHFNVLTMSPR